MHKYLNSNRSGHLAAATAASVLTTGAAIATGNLGLLISAPCVYLWEKAASPDRDIKLKPGSFRKNPTKYLYRIYWRRYTKIVGHHRSFLSHSIPVGTAIRLAYVFSIPAISLTALIVYMGLPWVKEYSLVFNGLLYVIKHVFIAAFIADFAHLLRDGYNPAQMILGE